MRLSGPPRGLGRWPLRRAALPAATAVPFPAAWAMMRQLTAALAWVICGLAAQSALAQGAPIISEAEARRHGFDRGWQTQVELDRLRDKVAGLTLSPLSQPDPTGLNRDMLFVLTDHSLLQALDANTGRTLWVKQVGERNTLTLPATADDQFVCVANGQVLHVLDRLNGETIWEKNLKRPPSQPPTIGPGVCHIPSYTGEVTTYPMPQKATAGEGWAVPKEEKVYKSFGSVDISPLTTSESTAWGTTRGFLFVGSSDMTDVRFRFETDRGISAPLGYWPPYILVASRDGFVYAVNEFGGGAAWQFTVGHAINQPPVAVDGAVYLISEVGGMHCLSAMVGNERWFTPEARQFVAASKSRVYVTDNLGRLLILDAKTGGRLDRLDTSRFPIKLINTKTDRIYLATPTGFIQSLHEIGQNEPLVHTLPAARQAEPEKPKKKPAKKADDDDTEAEEDADSEEGDEADADAEEAADADAEEDDVFGGDDANMEEEGGEDEEAAMEEDADADAEDAGEEDGAMEEDADSEDSDSEDTDSDEAGSE
jgi:outer membrane protein assembly factor BamB